MQSKKPAAAASQSDERKSTEFSARLVTHNRTFSPFEKSSLVPPFDIVVNPKNFPGCVVSVALQSCQFGDCAACGSAISWPSSKARRVTSECCTCALSYWSPSKVCVCVCACSLAVGGCVRFNAFVRDRAGNLEMSLLDKIADHFHLQSRSEVCVCGALEREGCSLVAALCVGLVDRAHSSADAVQRTRFRCVRIGARSRGAGWPPCHSFDRVLFQKPIHR